MSAKRISIFKPRTTPSRISGRISGKKEIAYPGSVSVHRRERLTGTFDRTLTVPMQIDADGIKAEYRDGVLALSLPRAASDKPRTIRIN